MSAGSDNDADKISHTSAAPAGAYPSGSDKTQACAAIDSALSHQITRPWAPVNCLRCEKMGAQRFQLLLLGSRQLLQEGSACSVDCHSAGGISGGAPKGPKRHRRSQSESAFHHEGALPLKRHALPALWRDAQYLGSVRMAVNVPVTQHNARACLACGIGRAGRGRRGGGCGHE